MSVAFWFSLVVCVGSFLELVIDQKETAESIRSASAARERRWHTFKLWVYRIVFVLALASVFVSGWEALASKRSSQEQVDETNRQSNEVVQVRTEFKQQSNELVTTKSNVGVLASNFDKATSSLAQATSSLSRTESLLATASNRLGQTEADLKLAKAEVEKLKTKTAARRVTERQKALLATFLSGSPKLKVHLMCTGQDAEAFQFMMELGDALESKALGFAVTRENPFLSFKAWLDGAPPTGLTLVTRGKANTAASPEIAIFAKALKMISPELALQADENKSAGEILIMVGSKAP